VTGAWTEALLLAGGRGGFGAGTVRILNAGDVPFVPKRGRVAKPVGPDDIRCPVSLPASPPTWNAPLASPLIIGGVDPHQGGASSNA
jgi:hypothetical protein